LTVLLGALGIAAFQSPLRRGSVFISASGSAERKINKVSIPSSSGKRLHQRRMPVLMHAEMLFQSPLRRGSVFIRRRRKASRAEKAVSIPSSSGKCLHQEEAEPEIQSSPGFNPLFVGEVSSSGAGSLRPAPYSLFQSPLRRGSVFIVAGSGNRAVDLPVSIPSSSGKCLHHVRSYGVGIENGLFQSPLRRGSVFITASRSRSRKTEEVSIPSSSGKCLHPGMEKSMKTKTASFNPLFVGEVSSSLRFRQRQPQQPCRFNPLFVGEVSSSRNRCHRPSRWHWFQSPLRRESVFIVPVVDGHFFDFQVSIPSSSGKCLHRTLILLADRESKNVSIPSSSGKCLHHALRWLGLDWEGEVSIPSSSGKCLHRPIRP